LNFQALPYIILTGVAFGANLVALRFAIGEFEPFALAGLRLAVASLAFLIVYLVDPRHHPWPTNRNLWRHILLVGTVGTAVPQVATVLSLQYQSSGITAILVATGPALTVLVAHFALADERLSWRKGMGVTAALGGALLLTLRGETGLPDITQTSPMGYGLIFLVLICVTFVTIYTRKYLRAFKPFDLVSMQMFISTLVVMPFVVILTGVNLQGVSGPGYIALAFTSLVGNFTAFLLYYYSIHRFGATTAAMTNYVIPAAALLGGVFILNETVTFGMMAGMGIIVFGISLVSS